MSNKFIPILLGTGREGRQSEKVAKSIHHIIKEVGGIKSEIIYVRDHTFGFTIPTWEENEKTKPWIEIVKKANGFIIVTPEYNHRYPGELKLLLDQELEAYSGKPVVLCGVSRGSFGGTRVVENLLTVLRALGLITSSYSLQVGNVEDFPAYHKPDKKFKEHVLKAFGITKKIFFFSIRKIIQVFHDVHEKNRYKTVF